ncbi:MAG: hypothetical protein AAGD38_02955 [Acidobacteriota bacterium]
MRAAMILMAILIGALFASPAMTEELVEIRDEFVFQARQLDVDAQAYDAARGAERDAIDELRRLGEQLDTAMADPAVAPAELLRLNDQTRRLSALVCERTAETAEARQTLFGRMERLEELVQEVETLGVEIVGPSGDVGGMWRIEGSTTGLYGLIGLVQRGSLVEGTYRLSNGRHGSVRGEFAGDHLELELVDSEHGKVGAIEGALAEGRMSGSWHAMELATDRPAAGQWVATRVSIDTVLEP